MINIGIADELEGKNILELINNFEKDVNLKTDYRIWVNELSQEKYDIFLINDFSQKEFIKSALENFNENGTVIFNADNDLNYPLSLNCPVSAISYGFNSRSTVTASSISSIGDYVRIQCCVQREMKDIFGKLIEPQEFAVSSMCQNSYNILSSASLLLLLGADTDKFCKLKV